MSAGRRGDMIMGMTGLANFETAHGFTVDGDATGMVVDSDAGTGISVSDGPESGGREAGACMAALLRGYGEVRGPAISDMLAPENQSKWVPFRR